ncbi:MAG: DNA-3-methyladenine glycosylase [Theionarchaea archaeon]|nr:DNA-3-methyladenine glycosylase [Theionarchaea archaeon]
MKVDQAFFERRAPVVARALIGCELISCTCGERTSGMIVETEAYGNHDPGSHASRGRTPSTEVLFGPPGRAYVYLIYGIHFMLNVVTGPAGIPSSVLLRALEPLEGRDIMGKRRGVDEDSVSLTNGPGNLTQALGISREHNRIDLLGTTLWIQEHSPHLPIATSRRVGVPDVRPWRFYLPGNPYVSPQLSD